MSQIAVSIRSQLLRRTSQLPLRRHPAVSGRASGYVYPQNMTFNLHRQMHSLRVEDVEKEVKEKKKRVIKDKNAPKRAKSAYIFFGGDMRETVKQENPNITTTEIMKELGVRWKALSASDKAPYDQLAATDKTRYTNELAVYNEKMAVEGGDANDDTSTMTNKNKKAKRDKDAPKRAKSAYIFFCSDMRDIIQYQNPNFIATEIMTELGARWKALSADEKTPYEAEAQADKIRFKEEMAAYEKKMK